MTYNVFGGTLNLTHSISLNVSAVTRTAVMMLNCGVIIWCCLVWFLNAVFHAYDKHDDCYGHSECVKCSSSWWRAVSVIGPVLFAELFYCDQSHTAISAHRCCYCCCCYDGIIMRPTQCVNKCFNRCCWSRCYDWFIQAESSRRNDQQLWPDALSADESQLIANFFSNVVSFSAK